MIIDIPVNPIPQQLSHYTKSFDIVSNILINNSGKILFRAVSNKSKNDSEEIKLGEHLLNKAKICLSGHNTLLNNISGYEQSASISFSNSNEIQYMLNNYGSYRLEFNLNNVEWGIDRPCECEYISKCDENKFINEYCFLLKNTIEQIFLNKQQYGKFHDNTLGALARFLMQEQDIMNKLFCLKYDKWKKEKEWRVVVQLKDRIYKTEGKEYVLITLPRESITGVTIFATLNDKEQKCKEFLELASKMLKNGYDINNIKLSVVLFNQ